MLNYHSLPDLEGYTSKAAKQIKKLAEEHAQKVAELSALGRDLEEARQTLQDARERDTEERALSERRGDEDPGLVHGEKAKERLEELKDRVGVMERVVADVERDLAAVITQTKAEIMDEAREKRDEANERFTEAKRAMRETHDEQRHHAGVVRWAHQASGHFSPPPPDMHVLSVPDRLEDEDPEKPALEVISTETAPGLLRGA